MDFQGALEDDRTPDHPTTCENLTRIFYFVKLREFWNPKLAAADKLLRHQRMILQARRKKSVYKDRLRLSQCCSSYYDEGCKRATEDLKALQFSLDKITFANKRCLIKPVGPNTPPEEIDNLGLHLSMLHRNNNLSDERKILKKTRFNRGRTNSFAALQDYDCRIRELQSSFGIVRHGSAMEKQRILMEITELKLAREAAVQSAVCKGELWESLGDKDGIQKKIKIIQEDIKASKARDLGIKPKTIRQFEAAAKDLARLDKQLLHTEAIIGLAFKSFRRWSNEYLQANTGYNQNVSFSNDARELAEKKDMASLRRMCERQTAMFMEKWNGDRDFRDDYKRRASKSLKSRGLCPDGRTRTRTPLAAV